MFCKKVLKLSLIAIILFSNAVIVFSDSKEDSKNKSKDEEKFLNQAAELKKQIFRWQLATLQDLKFSEKQFKYLRSERLKIKRAIERLEFMAKAQQKGKQVSSITITKSDEINSEEMKK